MGYAEIASENRAVNRGEIPSRRLAKEAALVAVRISTCQSLFTARCSRYRTRDAAQLVAGGSSAGVVITARKRNNLCGAARSKLLDKVLYNSFAAPRAREITAVNVIMKCVVEPKITRKTPTTRIISLRSSVLSCPERIAAGVRCYSRCNRGCAVGTTKRCEGEGCDVIAS